MIVGRRDENGIFAEKHAHKLKEIMAISTAIEIYYPIVQTLRHPGSINYKKFQWEIKQMLDFTKRGKVDLSMEFKLQGIESSS